MTSQQKEMISIRLRAIRNTRGLTQSEAGQITGLNAYYGNVERSQENYSDSVIIKIAEAFKVDPDWLLTGNGESPVPQKMESRIPDAVPPAPPIAPKKPDFQDLMKEFLPNAIIYNRKNCYTRNFSEGKSMIMVKKSNGIISFNGKAMEHTGFKDGDIIGFIYDNNKMDWYFGKIQDGFTIHAKNRSGAYINSKKLAKEILESYVPGSSVLRFEFSEHAVLPLFSLYSPTKTI